MALWLKQSTAATVKMGPFLDSTDGDTEETALTIAQADIRLSKNGGAFAQSNDATGATHDANGWYGVPLDATDTNTLGRLKVSIHVAGALAVWAEFNVVPASVWDFLFSTGNITGSVGSVTGSIGSIAANAVDANALATDAVTEIRNAITGGAYALNTDVVGNIGLIAGAITTAQFDAGAIDANAVSWVDANGRVDVGKWLGAAAATPTVAGVPEVDVTHLGGAAQSATDLKDFADAGYDPATNKVQGVVLVDTTTVNTDMRGTDSAALASVCTEARLAELDAANVPADLDGVKTVTDALTAASAALLAKSAGTIVSGAAVAGTLSTTQMTTDLTEATSSHYNGRIIIWTSGVLQNQATDITGYTGATKLLTYTAVTEAPSAADTFIIV